MVGVESDEGRNKYKIRNGYSFTIINGGVGRGREEILN